MILFLAALQRISARSVRGGLDRRRRTRLADVPLHHVAAAAGDRGRGAPAAPDQRLPGVRRVLQHRRRRRGYPPFARPPLVYLYYTSLGSAARTGLGSAGAVILAMIILLVTLLQGRASASEEPMRSAGTPACGCHEGSSSRCRGLADRAVHRGGAVPAAVLPAGAQRPGLAGGAHRSDSGRSSRPPALGQLHRLFSAYDVRSRAPAGTRRSSRCCRRRALVISLAGGLRPGADPVPALQRSSTLFLATLMIPTR